MKKIYLAISLVISGIISSYAPYLLAGVIFGVTIGIYIKLTEKTSPIKIIFWILMSWFAYSLAYFTAFFLFNIISIIAFICAGIVGSAILAFSTSQLVKKMSIKEIFIIIVVGSISGIAFILSLFMKEPNLVLGFVIWQLAVGFSLTYLVSENKQSILQTE